MQGIWYCYCFMLCGFIYSQTTRIFGALQNVEGNMTTLNSTTWVSSKRERRNINSLLTLQSLRPSVQGVWETVRLLLFGCWFQQVSLRGVSVQQRLPEKTLLLSFETAPTHVKTRNSIHVCSTNVCPRVWFFSWCKRVRIISHTNIIDSTENLNRFPQVFQWTNRPKDPKLSKVWSLSKTARDIVRLDGLVESYENEIDDIRNEQRKWSEPKSRNQNGLTLTFIQMTHARLRQSIRLLPFEGKLLIAYTTTGFTFFVQIWTQQSWLTQWTVHQNRQFETIFCVKDAGAGSGHNTWTTLIVWTWMCWHIKMVALTDLTSFTSTLSTMMKWINLSNFSNKEIVVWTISSLKNVNNMHVFVFWASRVWACRCQTLFRHFRWRPCWCDPRSLQHSWSHIGSDVSGSHARSRCKVPEQNGETIY